MKVLLSLCALVALVVCEPPAPNNQYLPPGAPSSEYGAPGLGGGANFNAPSQSYGAPGFNGGAPSQSYGAPGFNGGAPSQSYGVPGLGNGAPSQSYGAPSSRGRFGGNGFGKRPSSSFGGAPRRPSSSYGVPGITGAVARPSAEYGAPGFGGNAAGNGGYNYGRGNGGYDNGLSEPANYEFEYMVNDPPSGNDFGHKEARQGDFTQGRYYVLLPDGRTQIVDYEADQGGYRPTVRYEGEANANAGAGGYGRGPAGQSGGYASNGGYNY